MRLLFSLILFVVAGMFFIWSLTYLAIALAVFGLVVCGGVLFLVIRLVYRLVRYSQGYPSRLFLGAYLGLLGGLYGLVYLYMEVFT